MGGDGVGEGVGEEEGEVCVADVGLDPHLGLVSVFLTLPPLQ